jgi:phenylacetate-CoA ligase
MNASLSRRGFAAPLKRLALGEFLVRRNPLFHGHAIQIFDRLTASPLETRRSWHARRLERALRQAARTAYGHSLGAPSALEDWPLLEPADVRRHPRDFARANWWSIPSSTGGTSGIPLPLWRSPRSVAVEQAAIDGLLTRAQVDPRRARVAVLRGDDIKPLADRTPPFWRSAIGNQRLIFSSNHLGRETVAAFAAALTEFRADYWWVYPTALESLLSLTREAGLHLRVPVVLSSSEVLGEACRVAAREALGARVIDHYGQAERVAFSSSDENGEHRFLPGYSHVELLPVRSDEGPRYEIVGTSLWNEAMPLVRYRTGDLIRTERWLESAELEAIALGVHSFGGVIGRDGDILFAPDGSRLTGIDHFHRGVDRIVRIQVVQTSSTEVEIRVLPAPEFGESERAQLLANAARKLPPAMSVRVLLVDELERTALGKTPFVIRRDTVRGARS